MRYVALIALLALIVAGALFLRTDRGLNVKRLTYAMDKYELYDIFRRQAGVDFEKEWNLAHPDDPIQVRYDPIGGDVPTKLNAEAVAGTLQDVFFIEDFNEYARRGALLDLTPYVQKYHAQPLLDQIYPAMIEQLTVNGHLYGLPNNLCTDVLFYNRTLFDREKMPYPTADWDWNDMLAAAQRLTKRDAKGRLVQSGLTPFNLTRQWVVWNRGRIWTADGRRCVVDSPESLEALQFFHDLEYKYCVCPTLSEMRDTTGNMSFENNATAMMLGERFWTAMFKGLSDVNWAVAPLPRSFRGRRLCDMGFNCLAVNARTKYPDLAFQFLLHLTTPEQIKHLVDVGDSIPIHRGPEANAYFLNDPARPKGENAAYLMGMDDALADTGTDFLSPYIPRAQTEQLEREFEYGFTAPDADVPKLLTQLQDNLNALYAERTAPPVMPSIPAFVLALGLAACAVGGAIAWQVRSARHARG
jgi:multiple sugar transport system substrate-binding protein